MIVLIFTLFFFKVQCTGKIVKKKHLGNPSFCHPSTNPVPYKVPFLVSSEQGNLTKQKVFSWGSLAWLTSSYNTDTTQPQIGDSIADLGVKQICTGDKGCLILTLTGRVYGLSHSSPIVVFFIVASLHELVSHRR